LTKHTPPFVFFFLHMCTAWPVGVVSLAVSNRLVSSGISVHQTAGIVAAAFLPFSFEFLWAPMVDACWNRRAWFVSGAVVMSACLAALIMAPWNSKSVWLMTALAFSSCSGAAIAAVAVKGLMAYEVQTAKLGAASGFYTAGGTFAKAVAGGGTLWLLTHLADRFLVATLSIGAALLAATAILLVSPSLSARFNELPAKLRSALVDLWMFLRTRRGALIALLCVIPFGAGSEAGLIGAIAREWSVTPNQLAAFGTLSVVTGILGALSSGWLSTRIGPWRTYIILGWMLITIMLSLTVAPRTAIYFLSLEQFYRAASAGCYAALLGIVMTAIGTGAASTKAAALWSLANFASAYPTAIEGAVHDRNGTSAMLLTDAGLGTLGFGLLILATRLLGARPTAEIE
jgi:PAT family beta-lactamase induction signal transducer AmpG